MLYLYICGFLSSYINVMHCMRISIWEFYWVNILFEVWFIISFENNHWTILMLWLYSKTEWRCGVEKSGEDSDEAVDGIIGFGQANTSALSQLASAKKVKKVFSHCLDGKNGGGIFAIGEVVKPEYSSTPMVPDMYVIYHFIILWCRKIDFN